LQYELRIIMMSQTTNRWQYGQFVITFTLPTQRRSKEGESGGTRPGAQALGAHHHTLFLRAP